MSAKASKRFSFFLFITIILTYLVILAGAVVRTTQSGMGCPDWPKCFGRWIPPTEVSQLPANYQQVYAHRGYADTTFNAYHTWVEYVNRLLGALLGLVIFITLLFSLPYWNTNRAVFWLTFTSFILIGFQGWLGSLVVASNLAPVKITVHMFTALLLLALLVFIYSIIDEDKKEKLSFDFSSLKIWMYVALALTMIQILLGTQVRQQVDAIAKELAFTQREIWVDKLNLLFNFHRSFSILVLLTNTWILFKAVKLSTNNETIKFISYGIALLIIAEIVLGIILSYFAFPSAAQPLHLLFASLLFGVQFRFLMLMKKHQNG